MLCTGVVTELEIEFRERRGKGPVDEGFIDEFEGGRA